MRLEKFTDILAHTEGERKTRVGGGEREEGERERVEDSGKGIDRKR